ncbi:NADPH-dependent ferric siderophore reductase [Serinibacter arcticus]|uniref:NADPH-dependent ferric siderophore reductase n=2 Tax=Serinibacter arcticus TaxID=1655435 RepID=A0A2U1ZXN6_9MICO|nr:NADPH-dependent ferric siderophore reductase [Serinibacter arcticus]
MQVVAREWLTPHLVRLTFTGPDGGSLADFPMNDFTDAYVKVELAPVGVDLGFPYDGEEVRATRPPHEWPVLRTYTIRTFDAATGKVTMDFVVHGDEGIAGPWARDVEPFGPTSRVLVRGPGGAYAPDLDADHHLLVGDASALPAIANALERLPVGASADVVIAVEDSGDEIPLVSDADVRVRWVHAACADTSVGEAVVAVVRGLELPDGELQAFVHGEAGWVKALRSHLRFDRAIERERLSISGYWRLGANDEQWRDGKREWNASVEAEEQRRAS